MAGKWFANYRYKTSLYFIGFNFSKNLFRYVDLEDVIFCKVTILNYK